jgi:hypothetical protein
MVYASGMVNPTPTQIGGLALIAGLVNVGQRLGGWEHKPSARAIGVIASGLFCWWAFLYFNIWVASGMTVVVLLVVLFFARNWLPSTRERPRWGRRKELVQLPLLAPVIKSIEATDVGDSVVLRIRLLVSNPNPAEHTEICGFGLTLQDRLPTDHNWSTFPVGPSDLYKKTVLINHPIDGYIDFKIDKAKESDVKGRAVVVTILSGQVIDGVQKPYTTDPQTIHKVAQTTFAALKEELASSATSTVRDVLGPELAIEYSYEERSRDWPPLDINNNPSAPLTIKNLSVSRNAYNVKILPLTLGGCTLTFDPDSISYIAARSDVKVSAVLPSGALLFRNRLPDFFKAAFGLSIQQQPTTDRLVELVLRCDDGNDPPVCYEAICQLRYRPWHDRILIGEVKRRLCG